MSDDSRVNPSADAQRRRDRNTKGQCIYKSRPAEMNTCCWETWAWAGSQETGTVAWTHSWYKDLRQAGAGGSMSGVESVVSWKLTSFPRKCGTGAGAAARTLDLWTREARNHTTDIQRCGPSALPRARLVLTGGVLHSQGTHNRL